MCSDAQPSSARGSLRDGCNRTHSSYWCVAPGGACVCFDAQLCSSGGLLRRGLHSNTPPASSCGARHAQTHGLATAEACRRKAAIDYAACNGASPRAMLVCAQTHSLAAVAALAARRLRSNTLPAMLRRFVRRPRAFTMHSLAAAGAHCGQATLECAARRGASLRRRARAPQTHGLAAVRPRRTAWQPRRTLTVRRRQSDTPPAMARRFVRCSRALQMPSLAAARTHCGPAVDGLHSDARLVKARRFKPHSRMLRRTTG